MDRSCRQRAKRIAGGERHECQSIRHVVDTGPSKPILVQHYMILSSTTLQGERNPQKIPRNHCKLSYCQEIRGLEGGFLGIRVATPRCRVRAGGLTWEGSSPGPDPEQDLAPPADRVGHADGVADRVERERGAGLGGQDPRADPPRDLAEEPQRSGDAPLLASSGRARSPRRPACRRSSAGGRSAAALATASRRPASGPRPPATGRPPSPCRRRPGRGRNLTPSAPTIRRTCSSIGPSEDEITASPPSAFSSSIASRRRTTLIVLIPSCRASRMIIRPSCDPAADWSSHSPLGTARTCRTIARTVAGLTKNDATCSSGRSSATGRAWRAGITAYSAQFPPLPLITVTRFPLTSQPSSPGPTLSTTPTPSNPGVAGRRGSTP